jgi:hypothetical protein
MIIVHDMSNVNSFEEAPKELKLDSASNTKEDNVTKDMPPEPQAPHVPGKHGFSR